MRAIRIVAALAAAIACGCAGRQQHIVTGFGDSMAVFSKQAGSRQPVKPVTGLDSQEAKIVSTTYRQSLAPKETKAKEEPYIIVTPQQTTPQQPLLPSVPKEK